LSLGLFATGQYGAAGPTGADNSATAVVTGLFYGGGTAQLIGQAIGSAAITAGTVVMSLALMYAVKATGTLRVSKDGEMEGLDIHEHGGPAYPEFIGGFHGANAGEADNAPIAAHSTVAAK
jgi:Amt family ammonium transporter